MTERASFSGLFSTDEGVLLYFKYSVASGNHLTLFSLNGKTRDYNFMQNSPSLYRFGELGGLDYAAFFFDDGFDAFLYISVFNGLESAQTTKIDGYSPLPTYIESLGSFSPTTLAISGYF